MRGGGVEQKGKGLIDMDNSGVTAGGKGFIRELNGNGEKIH